MSQVCGGCAFAKKCGKPGHKQCANQFDRNDYMKKGFIGKLVKATDKACLDYGARR